ncbi:Cx9C motif-containing protein 4, mitochondrial [Elasticomyces elasticus]|nr:Cx9C motif-containing protein 4, mitochondrial [Elasticomyces elasticus]
MGALDDDVKTDPPCHPRACAIQDCIQKNNFDEKKCQKQIDALYECCNLFYQRNGDEASTVSCPKANLLRYSILAYLLLPPTDHESRLKMKQRAQGIK